APTTRSATSGARSSSASRRRTRRCVPWPPPSRCVTPVSPMWKNRSTPGSPTAVSGSCSPRTPRAGRAGSGTPCLSSRVVPLLGQIRAGDHLRSNVGYLRIGPDVAFVTIPAEIAGELVMGLPAGFRENPQLWYEEPELHVAPEDFHIPGYIRNRVPEKYLFAVGLGNDELGYVKSITDYRIGCVADQLAGAGACAQLHAIGAIEFPDGVAATTCKRLVEDPDAPGELVARFGAQAAQGVIASCDYGQTIAEADGHYPETNSAGWDMAEDILAAVGRLTGNFDPTEVNPDFPGYNDEFPPPATG